MRKETIAAIATGLTDSGIGIIRISGEQAVEIGNRMFVSPSGKRILKRAESHKLYYGFIINKADSENEEKVPDFNEFVLDEVMAVVMKAPKSFTGEDTVEIQCHGGILVMQKILELSLKCGARMAEPGEFSKRAFLNGRMDLAKAEAVMDVIHSQNEYALTASVNQLRGRLSEAVRGMREKLIYEIAFIESALDDPEHISLEDYPERLSSILKEIMQEVRRLLATAENGRWLKEGIRTVIIGKPNAGKSSLLNLLLGEERAIVTDVEGTTRDIIQETVTLDGIQLQVTDTAGIRQTEDTVEKIGVDRSRKYASDADLILYMVDSSVPLDDNDREIISMIQNKNVIVLLNKSDLTTVITENQIEEFLPDSPVIRVSALQGSGIELFEKTVKDMFFQGELKSNRETVLINMRHKEALQEALDSLLLVEQSLANNMPEDFLSIDLMSAYTSLGRIIGEEVDDDLVEEIFRKFCMGK